MKNVKRILCSVMAVALLLSVMLTGCGMPKIAFNKLPNVAATYGDGKTISTGEYLAYLYLEFENMYYNQGLYQYESYMDIWNDPVPLGEDGANVMLNDLIVESTQDNIARQIVLAQMMKDNDLKWIEEDEKEISESLAAMEPDAYLPLGFNNENYGSALKSANLNERSTFYGLYGKDGKRAVSEEDLKKYFEENYLSYKVISIPLTDKDNKELGKDSEARKKIMERLDKYLKLYEEKGFEEAKKAYDADEKAASSTTSSSDNTTTTTTTTTAADTSATTTTTAAAATAAEEHDHDHDHDHEDEEDENKDENRVDVDATTMDEELAKAIRTVEVGKAKVVEYKAGGSTPTAALIVRMDIHKDSEGKEDDTLYTDSVENIIYEKKYEDFNKEVEAAIEKLTIAFDKKVVKKCVPYDFLEIINNL